MITEQAFSSLRENVTKRFVCSYNTHIKVTEMI